MKNRIYKLFNLLLLVVAINAVCTAQDIHFSQTQNTPLYTNPSLTGEFGGDVRFVANYRNQWQSIPTPFNTAMISADTKFQLKNSFNHFGAGLLVYSDKAGDLGFSTTSVQLSLAYNMYLGSQGKHDFYFYTGAQYGRIQQGFDISAARLENPGQETNWNSSINYGDLTAGFTAVWVAPSFFLHGGFAVAHLSNPDISFQREEIVGSLEASRENIVLFRKHNYHLTGNFSVARNKLALLPAVQFTRQGESRALLTGMDLLFRNLKQKHFNAAVDWGFGVHHRWQDAIILTTKFRLANQYNFGFSYDLPVSKIGAPSNSYGAVEFFISFTIPPKFKQGDYPRQGGGFVDLKCPTTGKRPGERNPWYRENGVGY